MAETMVVEAALSAIFHAVFERIASSGVVNYFMERKLNDESLQKLKMFLLSANAVLVDAEEKQITNPAVKEWLDELNDAVHDAEDLLDEIAYEDLEYNLRAKSQTGTSKEWGLQALHSLRDFIIWSKYEELESFPEEALLPPTLTNFSISSFPNLKSLNGKGFQHLTSLQSLTIWSCDKLQCLPEQGLPTSLSVLQIFGCPLLNQQCEKEIGKDWLKIAHIPYIEID